MGFVLNECGCPVWGLFVVSGMVGVESAGGGHDGAMMMMMT